MVDKDVHIHRLEVYTERLASEDPDVLEATALGPGLIIGSEIARVLASARTTEDLDLARQQTITLTEGYDVLQTQLTAKPHSLDPFTVAYTQLRMFAIISGSFVDAKLDQAEAQARTEAYKPVIGVVLDYMTTHETASLSSIDEHLLNLANEGVLDEKLVNQEGTLSLVMGILIGLNKVGPSVASEEGERHFVLIQ